MNKLDELIPSYALNKNELDSYKKLCDKQNAEIKELMSELSESKYETGGFEATRTVQKRENINEEKLLEIAHHYGIPEIVKTKEYIDFDELENAIYNHKIPNEVLIEMDKAKEVKEVIVLKVKKVKKKED